jgi:hypothetical protein
VVPPNCFCLRVSRDYPRAVKMSTHYALWKNLHACSRQLPGGTSMTFALKTTQNLKFDSRPQFPFSIFIVSIVLHLYGSCVKPNPGGLFKPAWVSETSQRRFSANSVNSGTTAHVSPTQAPVTLPICSWTPVLPTVSFAKSHRCL